MKKKGNKNNVKRTYTYLNIFRIILCLFVLLYHLDIVKGGYLAVCSFFVISGYLSCINALKEDNFNLIKYYKKRFIKLYIPLLVVIFTTIGIISLFDDIVWLNIKKETISLLLGYNNWWQIKNNADYFAMSSASPFTHLWYISILFQLELIFPIFFKLLRAVGNRINKLGPTIISLVISILSFIVFYILCIQGDISIAYYNTFARLFSFTFGISLAFLHNYYGVLLVKAKSNIVKKISFYLYLIILILLFILIDSSSKLFAISMLISSLLTLRILDYIILIRDNEEDTKDKILTYLAGLSYLIYLVQYPIIFIFKYKELTSNIYTFYTIILTLLFTITINYGINLKAKNKLRKITKYITLLIISLFSIYGVYYYVTVEDPTIEIDKLKEQLAENEKLMQEQQEAYEKRMQEQQNSFNEMIADYSSKEENLESYVKNLNISFIGDSVMLGAVGELGKMFPNSYSDAKVSRSVWAGITVAKDLKSRGILGKVVVINLGANGNCSKSCKDSLMSTIGSDREVFWLTVTNDWQVNFNNNIKEYAKEYDNLHIIDWEEISKGHSEYFYADGLHLPGTGRKAYAQAIYDSLYEFYKEQVTKEKEEAIKKHEEESKKGFEFYGNELLLNVYNYIKDDYEEVKINADKDYKYETLYKELTVNKESLKDNILFAFDRSISIKIKDYEEIIELLNDKEIYIISLTESLTKDLNKLNKDNVHILDCSNLDLDDYLSDKIHLSDKGNQELSELIKENIKLEEN